MSEKKKLQEAIALFEAGRKYSKSGTIKINLNEDGYDVVLSALREKLETPRDWTPCAEGLPEDDDRFCAWMQLEATINTNGRLATRTVGRFYSPTLKKWFWADGWTSYPTEDGKGIEDANIGNVVAWRYPAPYRADDTTGKVKEGKEDGN